MTATDHAVHRYVQRFHKIYNITDEKSWKNFKLNNPEFAEQASKEVVEFFKKSTLLTKGTFIETGKPASFYYDLETTFIFVVDDKSKCIVTLYPVDFDFNDLNSNRAVLKTILEYIELKQAELQALKESRSYEFSELELEKKRLESEKEALHNKIKEIEIQQSILNNKKQLIDLNIVTLQDDLTSKYTRIIKKYKSSE